MGKMKLIKQHDEKDCGAASLSMILGYYGVKIPLASIREEIKVDMYGASIYGIIDGAKQNGLLAKAFKGNSTTVWEAIEAKEIIMPAIIRIVNQDNYEHFVVINGIRKNTLIVFDPGLGKYKMKKDLFDHCFLENIILFEKSKDFQKMNLKTGSLRRFTNIIFHQKRLLAAIGLLSMFVTGIGMAGTFLFQFIIDHVLGNISNENLLDHSLSILALIIFVLAILYLFKFIVELLRGKLLAKMSKEINLPLMLGYYDHVSELPMNFFENRKTGEIISRFNDASKICDAVSGSTLTIMIDMVLVAFCGIVLYKESSILFFVAIAILTVYVIISVLYINPLKIYNREIMEQGAQFTSFLKESIDGMETVKISQGESSVKEKTHNLFLDFMNKNIKGSMMEITKDSLTETFTATGTLILLWVGTMEVLKGTMTVGTLISFYSLMSYFLSPIQNILGLQESIQTALVAADRINDVMDLQKEQTGSEELNSISTIDFNNVSFRYGNRDTVLSDFSFTAAKGEQIALVGESGCGKSTAAKLTFGLYSPEIGTVSVNGRDLKEYSTSSLRNHMAFVPQTTFLFSDSIRNNILFGLNENNLPSDEEISKVLDICCCDFIKEMPFGIDSMLEENGANLSGGQRQRLAIARALLRKPDLLILDEATSALDTVIETNIQEALKKYYSNMIVITVAHRLSTVKNCSQIIVMDQGTSVERGNHEQLLKLNQRYALLWGKQNNDAA